MYTIISRIEPGSIIADVSIAQTIRVFVHGSKEMGHSDLVASCYN